MRLGTKLLLGFISIALLVLITGSLSYYLSNAVKNDLIETSELTSRQLQSLTEMTSDLQNSLLYTRNYLTEYDKRLRGDRSLPVTAQIRESRRIVEQSLDQFESDFKEFREFSTGNFSNAEGDPSFGSEIDGLADSLQVSFSYYSSLTRQIIDVDQTDFGNEIFNVTVEPYFRNTVLPYLIDLRGMFHDRVNLQLAELERRANTTIRQVIVITILAFLIAILFTFIVYQSIAKPIQKLQRTADELGSGDLSKRIHIQTKDELADLANSFNMMAENLSKSMVSRSYMNNIIQSMGDMLVVTDKENRVELINHAVSLTLNYEPKKLKGKNFFDLFNEDDRAEVAETYAETKSDNPVVDEWIMNTGTDQKIPVVVTHTEIQDQNGERKHIYVARDVTEQKEAEKRINDSLKEKDVMLSEIHHRVKNNLAVISGLLEMQVWNTEDESIAEILRDSQLKIKSMSLVHEKLYQNENFANIDIGNYTEELVSEIQKSYQSKRKNIEAIFDCDSISVTLNQAIPISLLLNESIVNIYKHAFTSMSEGAISIRMKMINGNIEIRISDNGIGLPDGFDKDTGGSMGLVLIDTLAKQLNGTYQFQNGEESGTELLISFPKNDKSGGGFVN
jgi:PAS domain S-box-containing protein